ncbi:hypothetical protein [Kribbella sp. CA-294648]|uniref:hypothetical protein n=1 Tax=Kribbella sp. CA-294648 TaxID=3239948 RepID=UPI003D8F7E89
MSAWNDFDLDTKVRDALTTVPIVNEAGHHYGRAWITTYQLAIKIHELNEDLAARLNLKVGGLGTGEQSSLAQYLARQISAQIKRLGNGYPIEGAFLSGIALTELSFKMHDGSSLTSSVTGSGYDLSLFRLSATGTQAAATPQVTSS